MRGSPLIRTVVVLLALVVSGIGFARLTQRGTKQPPSIGGPGMREPGKSVVTARCFLTLSSPASSVSLGGKAIERVGLGEFSGTVDIDTAAPVVFLKVEWKEDTGSRRFAKLVLEAPGEETFTHVFDAPGDIDDFVEPPF